MLLLPYENKVVFSADDLIENRAITIEYDGSKPMEKRLKWVGTSVEVRPKDGGKSEPWFSFKKFKGLLSKPKLKTGTTYVYSFLLNPD